MTLDQQKLQQLEALRSQVRQLESEILTEQTSESWPPQSFYSEYYATTGFILGMVAAAASLLVNVIGAPVAGKSPLQLIRIYLTFPFGEKALELTSQAKDVYVIGDGLILAMGCCLYLGTGALFGVPFFVILGWLTEGKSTFVRLIVATLMGILLWLTNFYAVLSWLQPALFGGHWIVDPDILPRWVAVLTHLVFAWTLALLYPWGRFQGYATHRSTGKEVPTIVS